MKRTNFDTTGSLEEYIKVIVFNGNDLDMLDPDDSNLGMLQTPPTTKAIRYSKMRAYGVHWCVASDQSECLNIYDSSVAVMESYNLSTESGKGFVGVLQHILKLDYGPSLNTPIYLFVYEWRKHQDTHSNKTYVRDRYGFLLINFKHKVSKSVEPYAFPQQCTQVFSGKNDLAKPCFDWRIVLHFEPWSQRVVEDEDDTFISMTIDAENIMAPSTFNRVLEEPNLVGNIELNDIDNAIALQDFNNIQCAPVLPKKTGPIVRRGRPWKQNRWS